jgi:hypothetical protein
MGGDESEITLDQEAIEDLLDDFASLFGPALPRSEMKAWDHGEYSDYDGFVVTANASLELAQDFAFELNKALPDNYYVEIGKLGAFYIVPAGETVEQRKGV